jgi:uncharacterized membrane protein
MHAYDQAAPPPLGAGVRFDQIHRFFMSFPIACFTLALASDVAYWRTSFLMWHDVSSWLLFAGLVGGGLALVFGLVGLLFRPRLRPAVYWLTLVVVLALGLLNSFVHAGDGWTAIVPRGLAISALTVAVLLAALLVGSSSRAYGRGFRHA